MNRSRAFIIPLLALTTAPLRAQTLEVSSNGARESVAGPPGNFTGSVYATRLFAPGADTNAGGTQVEFAPEARSVWHTHPAGQTLIITSGIGWVQQEGGPKITVRPGDVVTIPAGVKHWHGATATNSMSHLAITPFRDGKNVDWMEPVADAEYRSGAQPTQR